ncbi:DUF6263 family protein [Sphingobacterium daejeonense]|uniref:DUF6263 family protein n=1 Tax=Sphingobacterium daejeonense TaxID=371142 RepID=UPI0010C34EC5|nr:DUF6263 family protein [Sphingobacterium daejeonense]VTQ08556.1 Uncharacterised protein [Sphingobacterium daejeonense]
MKKLLVLFLLSSAALSIKAQEVDFKMKLPLNEAYKSSVTMKMDIEGQQSMIMDMAIKSTVTPTKLEGTNYTFESIMDAVKVDMDAGMMTMSYDSETPSDDPTSAMLGAQFEKMLGKKMIMVTSDRGKLISSEGIEGMDNALDNMGMTASYPEKAVKPGDTWPSEVEAKGIKTVANNKFVGKTDEGYQIESIGEMKGEGDAKIGNFNANYIVDPVTFFTKSATIKMDMEVEGQKVSTDMIMSVTK